MKKLISFILTMVPVSLYAAPIYPDNNNGSVIGAGGLSVTNMYIGMTIPETPLDDTFYAGPDINQTGFTIKSDGAVEVSDTLEIAQNYSLALTTNTVPSVNMSFGAISAGGMLTIDNADAFNVTNSLIAGAGLSVNANTMTTGAVNIGGGNTNITLTGALSTDGFVNSGAGDVTIIASEMTSDGSVQNNGGDFIVELGGDLTVNQGTGAEPDVGSLENSGTSLIIRRKTGATGVDINVAGTVKNDSNNGSIIINADSLTVNGGDSVTGASFVNAGDLDILITGTTTLEHGFNLNNMAAENTFKLITGNLVFGEGTSADALLQISVNRLNNFYLEVNQSNLTLTQVLNGSGNQNATMQLLGQSVTADSVTNNGKLLEITALQSNGSITVNGNVTNTVGDLEMVASNIDISGNLINSDGITSLKSVDTSDSLNPVGNLVVNVNGDVTGGVQFIGLKEMTIGENFIFDNNSLINAAILPYGTSGGNNSTRNYWSSVSLNDDGTLGQITNAPGGQALITVGGTFVSNVSGFGAPSDNNPLQNGQIGIDLFSIVDQGTAIWLLDAGEGIQELADKIRNLNVNFCNADGSICFNYLEAYNSYNGADEDLPVYLSMRDTDNDGVADSVYIVFDPRFGGPVEVSKIQPIVAKTSGHTEGEYVSAGALDNLVAGQLANKNFWYSTPIEAIPYIFSGTNLATMSNELYKRMEFYQNTLDGTALARFSRLFQARELENIAGGIALNEHLNARDFEHYAFDEFIWNRNRNLKKAWLDIDFGMVRQDGSDDVNIKGNRFKAFGGFDWQESETMIVGLAGRISNMSGDSTDSFDLSYGSVSANGCVDINVDDTNIGVGGYMMKILGEKTRIYGNVFLDMHLFDITRTQNYVSTIDGDGTSFSLISEWGLLHDWLNQYIVGNMYARVGYNFGFSGTEQSAGQEYMELQSDGYFILTPGYSLIAQKRIYPSAWMQIRPYASVGVEYDVLGMPDFMEYKFALAHDYTKYDIDINPLWANMGAGIEVLGANGMQVGLGYKYQYNDMIQIHNIKLSGSYRF